jgi:predicted enzyme related to lactoylglutathione lyase
MGGMNMEKHSVCHFEWSSTDLETAQAFYTGLFGWKFSPWGKDYLVFRTPEGPNGGIMKVDKVVPGKSPYIYIQVEEIEPYLEKAKELGGGVDTLKKEIPKVGYFAHVLDPDGNIVGLFEDFKKE